MGSHHCLLLRTGTMDCVAMEAEKKAAALKAAALVDKPPHALIAVNIDSKEAELSWLGSWLVYFLVATVEIIISAANTTFNQILFPCFHKADEKMNEQAVVVEKSIKDKIQKALNRCTIGPPSHLVPHQLTKERSTAGQVWSGGVKG